MKTAIVLLTRGYKDIRKYEDLIKRNTCISRYLKDTSMDILIFHEGNMLEDHANLIHSKTPCLNIKFINIREKNKAFLKSKEQVPVHHDVTSFGIGYRHMCSFWFVNFWNYVEEYDAILRIDEDCFIEFDINQLFYTMQSESKVAIYGTWSRDEEFVTKELNNFTYLFFKNIIKQIIPRRSPSGPYTNVIALNLQELRKNELLKKYIEYVDRSNAIYMYRWGDLPLWGEVLTYFYDKDAQLNLKELKYYHGSHNIKIN